MSAKNLPSLLSLHQYWGPVGLWLVRIDNNFQHTNQSTIPIRFRSCHINQMGLGENYQRERQINNDCDSQGHNVATAAKSLRYLNQTLWHMRQVYWDCRQ